MGVRVYALSNEPVANLKELQEKYGTGVTLLSDPDGKAIAAFGMVDEGAFPEKKNLARAGVFHIDSKGMVRHVWLTDSYRRRPGLDAILDAIKG